MRYAILTLLVATAPALALDGSGGSKSGSGSGRSDSGGSDTGRTDSGNSKSSDGGQSSLIAVALTGAVAIGITLGSGDEKGKKRRKRRGEALRALAVQLDQHRPTVVRDLVRGEGPVLTGWLTEIGLTPAEQSRFRETLTRSRVRVALLQAIQGGPADAARFADGFGTVLRSTLSPARWAAISEQG